MANSLSLSKTTKILQRYLQISFPIQINFLIANVENSYFKKDGRETYFFLLFFFFLEKESLNYW